jgi:hypothetical protein
MKSEFGCDLSGRDEFDDFACRSRRQAGERQLVVFDFVAAEVKAPVLPNRFRKLERHSIRLALDCDEASLDVASEAAYFTARKIFDIFIRDGLFLARHFVGSARNWQRWILALDFEKIGDERPNAL